jgi:hypothetical protein
MSISERIEGTIDNWREKWQERLKEWLADVLKWGLELLMDVLGQAFAPKLRPFIDKIEANAEIPPEFKPLFDEVKNPTGQVAGQIANAMGSSLVGGVTGRLMDWLLRPLMIALSMLDDFFLLDPFQLITLLRRGKVSPENYENWMRARGIHPDRSNDLYELTQVRFPSEIAAPAWLRDKEKYGWLWQDVLENGVDPERIKVLQELAHVIPQIRDVILFAVREVYTPEIAEEFGQFEDYPELAEKDAERAGVRPEDLRKFWASHWGLPSTGEAFEMYHRGKIDQELLFRLLRAKDIMPFWRDKLTEIAWNLPNRIELRMMARYGLVDKPFLVDMLKNVGLAEEYRDVAADMMLVMGIRTDFATRYRNKWINAEELEAELAETGLAPEIQERLYKWIVKNFQQERVEDELKLTKAEIVKGVKRGVIEWDEGLALLEEKGYDIEEAMFVLAVNIEALAGSPNNFAEFKRLTQLERLATGHKTERTKEEITGAETELGKVYAATPPISEEERKVKVDTIRRQRRRQDITRDQEIVALREIGISESLAITYADNDDLRLQGRT